MKSIKRDIQTIVKKMFPLATVTSDYEALVSRNGADRFAEAGGHGKAARNRPLSRVASLPFGVSVLKDEVLGYVGFLCHELDGCKHFGAAFREVTFNVPSH